MKALINFLFGSVFVLIVSLAVFLPLSLLRLSPGALGSLVLGEATSAEQIQVSPVEALENSAVTVTALAYPDQKTYYHKIFRVRNNFSSVKSYKVEVLSVLPTDPNFSAQVYFESPGQPDVFKLLSGEEKEVNLLLALSSGSSTDTPPAASLHTLKIFVLPVD